MTSSSRAGSSGTVPPTAAAACCDELGHQLAPLLAVHDDPLGGDGVEIAVGVGNLEGGEAPGRQPRGGVGKAGAAAGLAAGHAGPGDGHHGAAVEGDDPAQRARVGDAAAVPAHGLAPAQPAEQIQDERGQDLGGRFPSHPLDRVDVVVAHFQVLHGDALPPGEAFQRLGGAAQAVIGLGHGRPTLLDDLVGLHGRQLGDQGHQPPRRPGDAQARRR